MVDRTNDPITLYENIAREHVFPFAKDMGGGTFTSHGITKRELIAAMLMQGLFANSGTCTIDDSKESARRAVLSADALLAALQVTPP